MLVRRTALGNAGHGLRERAAQARLVPWSCRRLFLRTGVKRLYAVHDKQHGKIHWHCAPHLPCAWRHELLGRSRRLYVNARGRYGAGYRQLYPQLVGLQSLLRAPCRPFVRLRRWPVLPERTAIRSVHDGSPAGRFSAGVRFPCQAVGGRSLLPDEFRDLQGQRQSGRRLPLRGDHLHGYSPHRKGSAGHRTLSAQEMESALHGHGRLAPAAVAWHGWCGV